MSRIDEALKRAAGNKPSAAGRADISLASASIEELAREAYQAEERDFPSEPVQMPKAESRAAVTAFATAVASATEPATDAVQGPVASEMTATSTDVLDEEAPGPSVLGGGTSFSFERIDARYAGKTVVDQDISPTSREQYRRLAASLHHAKEASGLTIVMVTSAVSGEGKTLTSSNLALTLSESYRKNVLLIDTDLRKPSLHSVFRVRSESGLSEGLASGSDRTVPIYQVAPKLAILAAGRPTSDPIAHLTSPRMRRLLDEARNFFDWIILDTPPVALLPDANLLSSIVDGAVLVVKAGGTPYPLVERAVDAVGRNKTLGVVLNRTVAGGQSSDYYGYYNYAYGARPETNVTAAPKAGTPPG